GLDRPPVLRQAAPARSLGLERCVVRPPARSLGLERCVVRPPARSLGRERCVARLPDPRVLCCAEDLAILPQNLAFDVEGAAELSVRALRPRALRPRALRP